MCRVCGCYIEGNSGDGCDLPSTLCEYDFRKGDFFVLSWARVRQLRQGNISSGLLLCGVDVRSILLLPLVARCLETIDVCIWRMFVFMSVVGVCVGLWEVDCVTAVVEDNGLFEPWSGGMLYVCVRDVLDVVFSVWIVRRGAVSVRVS